MDTSTTITNQIPKSAGVQSILAKAEAYKQGAMWGAGAGLLFALFVLKGRYVLCIVGGAVVGGYFKSKMTDATEKVSTTFTNYGIVEPENTNNSLQTAIINNADGK